MPPQLTHTQPPAHRGMRVLSPRMAPPLACELGSIASTATRSPASSMAQPSVSMSELLPAPGGPDTPTRNGSGPGSCAAAAAAATLAARRSATRRCRSRSSLAACAWGWAGRVSGQGTACWEAAGRWCWTGGVGACGAKHSCHACCAVQDTAQHACARLPILTNTAPCTARLQLVVEPAGLGQRDAAADRQAAARQDALRQLIDGGKLLQRGHVLQRARGCGARAGEQGHERRAAAAAASGGGR